MFRWSFRITGLVVGHIVLIAAWLLADIWLYGYQSDPAPADAALVLGAAVSNDHPTPVFEERIRHAVDLYNAGQVKVLVMSGGRDPHDKLSEAVAARDWAVAQGVPASAILLEDQSRTTLQNMRFTRQLLSAHNIGRVLVVSDPLHMKRAVDMARDNGLDAYPSPTPTSRYRSLGTQVPMLINEAWFYLLYRLRSV
jgi:uncharacterized SAM-binding protein YcdF (DUF218 family)